MRHITLFVSIFGLFVFFACTGDLDWTGVSFPCSDSRPCATGFVCDNGTCKTPNSIPDGGNKPENKVDPDSPFRPAVTPKVAFLYVGPVGDFGWTWAHEQGRLHLKKLGYETTFAGPIGPNDAPAEMKKFIAGGYNLMVGTSHDFLVPLLETAAENTSLNFLTCSGFKTTPNMGSYFARMYQIEWLAGKLAGSMTKTNRIGFLAPIAIPEVIRHINAFTLGVRSVNPNAVVVINWIGNWFNPKTEPILTQELLAINADVIHSHSDTSIPLELIENASGDPLKTKDGNNVYTIGYNGINACDFGPRTCLASAYWNWGPIMQRIVEQLKDGKWDPKNIIWEQFKNDKNASAIYLSDISNKVPGAARVAIQNEFPNLAKEDEKSRQIPFVDSLIDNADKERAGAGKTLTDKQLLEMCWYVKGVMDLNATKDDIKASEVPAQCLGDR